MIIKIIGFDKVFPESFPFNFSLKRKISEKKINSSCLENSHKFTIIAFKSNELMIEFIKHNKSQELWEHICLNFKFSHSQLYT